MLLRMLLLCCMCYCVQAQESATKSYTKNIAGAVLVIHAEKASITITGWEKEYIGVRLDFTASHPDKKTALEELNYMQFMLAKEGDQVELRNYFKLPATVDHIKSKLVAKMELMVPSKNKLQVTNKYGDLQIRQVSGALKLDMSYGDIQLQDIGGAVTVRAAYSELRGSGISAPSFQCTDETSTIVLGLDAGNYSFTSKHGNIDLRLKNIGALNITANRSDITIHPHNVDACRYKVFNTAGKLYLPEKYMSRVHKKGNQFSFITNGAASLPLLAINANYNSVTIK
jgi:hypothetical protein